MARLPDDPGSLNRLAATASVIVAAALIAAKLATWLLTGSIALLASLVDSCMDALASIVTLVSVRQAAQPADRAHRYGHGKAEAIGALVQAAFLAGSAIVVASEAGRRLINPQPIRYEEVGIAVMVFAVLLTAGLVFLQRAAVRRTGSIAISADQWHYQSDLVTNLAVIAALVLTAVTGFPVFDPLFACGVVLLLLYGAGGIGRRALDMLMDRELPHADRARIRELALAHPLARGLHDLRTRRAGGDLFIELHLELDAALPLVRAHEITHQVVDRIRAEFPSADILVHQEPAGVVDIRLDEQVAAAARR